MELTGQVAIVTGAGQGMGRGIAEKLSRDGATVVVAGRTEEKLLETVRIIECQGGKALAVQADISDISDIQKMFEQCQEHFGAPDIFVANVSICPQTPLVQVTEEEYDDVFDTNAKGTMFCLKEAGLRLKDGGRIVATTSATVRYPQRRMGVYVASKAAIVAMVEVAALEFAERGITVNSVMAGVTETPCAMAVIPVEFQKFIASQTPMKRLGTPQDIAEVVAFLCSKNSQWVTGQHILANGGAIGF